MQCPLKLIQYTLSTTDIRNTQSQSVINLMLLGVEIRDIYALQKTASFIFVLQKSMHRASLGVSNKASLIVNKASVYAYSIPPLFLLHKHIKRKKTHTALLLLTQT